MAKTTEFMYNLGMSTQAKKTVTQNDVAREAGVTRSMVSYVISGNTERSVAPETRKKILEVIDRLGYRPNKAAQALQQGDIAFAEKRIGVILNSADVFRRPYYAEIIAGIHTAAHQNNYHVSFIRFFDELKNPVLFNELIHSEEIGGLILVSTDQSIKCDDDKKIIQKIKDRIENVVCVEWKCDGLSSVMFDRQETARKATEFLISKKYPQIIYIGQNDDRVLGVQQALMLSGYPSVISEFYKAEAFDLSGGYQAIKNLFSSGEPLPRAIVCGSDEVAIGAMCCLNENDILIPQQVALISIDNLEVSEYTNPPLTTMNVQKANMGERAVEMIVKETARQGNDAVCISLSTNLVERKSC